MRCKQSFDLINYLVRMLSACWLIWLVVCSHAYAGSTVLQEKYLVEGAEPYCG